MCAIMQKFLICSGLVAAGCGDLAIEIAGIYALKKSKKLTNTSFVGQFSQR
ncbi:unannotated protein [freshwater metagenome]|uniref:Unannotated protein n=1 Tax=freshwater metagenome TaxID=449393 RepID=A0A6J6HJY9_9ZZZZ